MAAHVARRRFASGMLPAVAATVAGTAAYSIAAPQTVQCEDSKRRQDKLPIYSSQAEPITLVEVRGPLEEQVADARKAILNSTTTARAFVRGQVDRWIGVEKSVENRVSSLIPNDEQLTPNILYVGVATLAGSVFTRYRSLPVRLLTPPVLLITSMQYLLPKTTHNLSQYYLELESRHLPEQVRVQRQRLVQGIDGLRNRAGNELERVREGSGDLLQKSLKSVEGSTGLKIANSGRASAGAAAGQHDPRMV